MKMPDKEIELNSMLWDLKRFPLPIEFDPKEEAKALFRRDRRIEKIYERYMKMFLSNSSQIK